jgi:hypothetical protein
LGERQRHADSDIASVTPDFTTRQARLPVLDDEPIMVPHPLSGRGDYPRSPRTPLGGKPGKRAGLRGGNRFGGILGKQQAFIDQP